MPNLSSYFIGVAAKRLSAVETNPKVSNQHEFQGIKEMVEIFGTARKTSKCTFLYLGEDEDTIIKSEGTLTWYDAREKQPHRSPEYRYYYTGNNVTEVASEGDLLIIARKTDSTLLALVVRNKSTIEAQVLWLFGLHINNGSFVVSKVQGEIDRDLGYVERAILESIGEEFINPDESNWLELIFNKFRSFDFPSTRSFSLFARETIKGVSSRDNPDEALIYWLSHEEMLFKTLEKYHVELRLQKGFQDVEDFFSFSKEFQQRRRSRMGYSLENHLKQIFDDFGIQYSRGRVTENNSKPDFIFPAIDLYHDLRFPTDRLTMLGVKSTCKDRWRQVLAEAKRIEKKHLITLEPGISENQTNEMKDNNLQLILPSPIHKSYTDKQQEWLFSISDFIGILFERQY